MARHLLRPCEGRGASTAVMFVLATICYNKKISPTQCNLKFQKSFCSQHFLHGTHDAYFAALICKSALKICGVRLAKRSVG